MKAVLVALLGFIVLAKAQCPVCCLDDADDCKDLAASEVTRFCCPADSVCCPDDLSQNDIYYGRTFTCCRTTGGAQCIENTCVSKYELDALLARLNFEKEEKVLRDKAEENEKARQEANLVFQVKQQDAAKDAVEKITDAQKDAADARSQSEYDDAMKALRAAEIDYQDLLRDQDRARADLAREQEKARYDEMEEIRDAQIDADEAREKAERERLEKARDEYEDAVEKAREAADSKNAIYTCEDNCGKSNRAIYLDPALTNGPPPPPPPSRWDQPAQPAYGSYPTYGASYNAYGAYGAPAAARPVTTYGAGYGAGTARPAFGGNTVYGAGYGAGYGAYGAGFNRATAGAGTYGAATGYGAGFWRQGGNGKQNSQGESANRFRNGQNAQDNQDNNNQKQAFGYQPVQASFYNPAASTAVTYGAAAAGNFYGPGYGAAAVNPYTQYGTPYNNAYDPRPVQSPQRNECGCDDDCVFYGDCCNDYDWYCVQKETDAPPTAPTYGGWPGYGYLPYGQQQQPTYGSYTPYVQQQPTYGGYGAYGGAYGAYQPLGPIIGGR